MRSYPKGTASRPQIFRKILPIAEISWQGAGLKKSLMRPIIVLSLILLGVTLVDAFALDGRILRDVVSEARQTGQSVRASASSWASGFAR